MNPGDVPAPIHGQPTDETPEDQAFAARLTALDERLDGFYLALGVAADDLDVPTAAPLDPDHLVDLGRRMVLGRIREHVMAARHEIHGAQTASVLGRREVHPLGLRRPRATPS